MESFSTFLSGYDRRLFLALIFSLLLGVSLGSLGFTTSDADHHMFASEHYAENWFSLYNTEIGGGTDMSTYPPLAYQLIAAASFFIPVEASYWAVLIASWMVLSLSFTKFLLDYMNLEKEYGWFVYLATFTNVGVLKTFFVYSQGPTMVGIAFGFTCLYYLNKSIDTGRKAHFVLYGLFNTLTAFTHVLAFIFTGFLIAFLILSRFRDVAEISFWKKFVPSVSAAAIISATGLIPFLRTHLLSPNLPLKSIPHFSRLPVWERALAQLEINFVQTYGLSLIVLVLPVYLLLTKSKSKNALKLYLIGIFFFIVGLGYTTPLPEILFWDMADVLTYERFALIASIIFTGIFAALTYQYILGLKKDEVYGRYLAFIFIFLIIVVNCLGLFRTHYMIYDDYTGTEADFSEEITDYILEELKNRNDSYRYQTLGYRVNFTEPVSRIYRDTEVPTLDTMYFTERRPLWFRNSGIETIDWSTVEFINQSFMPHVTEESVKYVFTIHSRYYGVMKAHGWKKVKEKNFGYRKVTTWENPEDVAPVDKVRAPIDIENYLWGITPLMTLLSALISYIWFESEVIQELFNRRKQLISS